MVYGIIYRIINIANGKCYIGKTKSHYGKIKYGITGRFRQHKVNAFIDSKKNECPLLYNAIRKYGKESFIIETLLECNLEDVDCFEIKMINIYDSCNKNLGYNIAAGGRGRSIVEVSEETREKISKSQSSEITNIKPVIRKGNLVGYRIRRRQNGKIYQKTFTNTKNTPEENFKLAK
jgi:group I intron endonuclease